MAPLHLRLANELDITDIKALMQRAIRELQKGYLTEVVTARDPSWRRS